jgi:hypothetical protein
VPEGADETGAPSYEELAELVAVQKQLIEEQTQRIARLGAELEELRRRVGRNPRNSSIPPSAEGLAKPVAKNRAERRAEKRDGAGGFGTPVPMELVHPFRSFGTPLSEGRVALA